MTILQASHPHSISSLDPLHSGLQKSIWNLFSIRYCTFFYVIHFVNYFVGGGGGGGGSGGGETLFLITPEDPWWGNFWAT